MRQKRTIRASLLDLLSDHQIRRELSGMSDWLDRHTDLFVPVAARISVAVAGKIPTSRVYLWIGAERGARPER